MNPHGPVKRK